MKIAELYLLPGKKEAPLPVKTATLHAGVGMEGDCHAGEERQISLWDSRAKSITHNLAYGGLCMKRFFASIILDGLGDAALRPGDRLQCGSAVIRITHTGKRCYPDECELPRQGVVCPLQCCAYGVVESSGVLLLGDGVLHKPGGPVEV